MQLHPHLVGHLVRRGVEQVTGRQQYLERLQQDAAAYENAGDGMEVKARELLPILITVLIGSLVVLSIDYTIGQVMGSLAMIESSSTTTTTIIESKPPPPYTDDADKELLLPDAAPEASDVELLVVEHKPITSKIRTTMGHLQRIGGFRARWRGLGIAFVYHLLHNGLASLITHSFDLGLVGATMANIFASLIFARLHMNWTHAMIAYPQPSRWSRIPRLRDCKALYLPAFFYALAQQATTVLPVALALDLGLIGPQAHENLDNIVHSDCPKAMALLGLRYLSVVAIYAFFGLTMLFPASVTLTRIEALLLPEGEETIVPFDRQALTAGIDLQARGASKLLFAQAWTSFDRASMWRVVKLYVKMNLVELVVMLVTVHAVIFEMYVIGLERLAVFFRSVVAQLKLMAIEAHKVGEDATLVAVEGN